MYRFRISWHLTITILSISFDTNISRMAVRSKRQQLTARWKSWNIFTNSHCVFQIIYTWELSTFSSSVSLSLFLSAASLSSHQWTVRLCRWGLIISQEFVFLSRRVAWPVTCFSFFFFFLFLFPYQVDGSSILNGNYYDIGDAIIRYLLFQEIEQRLDYLNIQYPNCPGSIEFDRRLKFGSDEICSYHLSFFLFFFFFFFNLSTAHSCSCLLSESVHTFPFTFWCMIIN